MRILRTRVWSFFTPPVLRAVDRFQTRLELPTRSEAVRVLVEKALKNETRRAKSIQP